MDSLVTVVGNLAADPEQRMTASGATVVSLRLAASPRRFDRESGQWRDGDPMFITASCWRTLAANVMGSLRKGDGVVVHGRLTMRVYDDRQGIRRTVHELQAVAVGPDLTRCPVTVQRPARRDPAGTDPPPATGGPEVNPEPPVSASVAGHQVVAASGDGFAA